MQESAWKAITEYVCVFPSRAQSFTSQFFSAFWRGRRKKKIHHFGTPLAEEASVSTFLTGFSFLAKLIFNGGWEASMTNICFPIHKQACELRLWTLPSEKSDSKMAGGGLTSCAERGVTARLTEKLNWTVKSEEKAAGWMSVNEKMGERVTKN